MPILTPTLALLSGSMNPVTLGHQHLMEVSLHIFNRLVIGIGHNPLKKSEEGFTLDERLDLIRACVSGYGDRVSVQAYEGATVDFALAINATAMVRGIRNGTDHAYEASMGFANALMAEEEGGRRVPTIYLQCPPELMEISSSRVRELMLLGRSDSVLKHYVAEPVLELIRSKRA